MLSIHLWPYAMHMANEIMISTPTKDGDKSPQELFSGVNILPKIKHFHIFACPTTYWTMPYKGNTTYQSGKNEPD